MHKFKLIVLIVATYTVGLVIELTVTVDFFSILCSFFSTKLFIFTKI